MDIAELGYKIQSQDAETADRRLKNMADSSDRAEKSAEQLRRQVIRTAAGIAAMVVSVQTLRSGLGTIASYGQEMSTVRAITQATAGQFADLSEEAQRLGATTRFSASEAAQGMAFLARAGFSAEEALAATQGTLTLAQAGALGLGEAADIASNVLTGFRLNVDETGRVVDVLAYTANNANTTVGQLGEAMSYVAPVAAGLGVSVEEASAAIAALSDAGIQGSSAGTGLRRVLSSLESPTGQATAILNDLGLAAEDVRVSQVGLTGALQALAQAGIDTGTALELFGDRGGPAFEVLSSSIPRVQELDRALAGAGGTAERIARVMDDNLNGALLAVRSASEAVTLAFGEMQGSSLEASARTIAAGLRAVADNAQLVSNVVGAGVVGFAAYRAALLVNTAAVGQFTFALGGMTTTMGSAIVATRALAAAKAVLLGPLGIALLAATSAGLAFAAMGRSQEEQARRAQSAAEAQDQHNAALETARRLIAEQQPADNDNGANTFAEGIAAAARYRDELDGVSEAARAAKIAATEAARAERDAQQEALEAARARVREMETLARMSGSVSGDDPRIQQMRADVFDLERGLASAQAALDRLLNSPAQDFDPEAEARARAYSEAERSLDRQLQLATMRTDLERGIASALWDAGLALNSQGEEAENIRRLATEIYQATERRAEQEERIREAQELAARQAQSLEDARARLELVQIEDETRRSIAEQMARAGFEMEDQSDAAVELRDTLTEIAAITERRAEAERAATEALRAQEAAARQVQKLRYDMGGEGGELVRLQQDYELRLEALRQAQENEQALIEQGILREGELLAMRNQMQRQYDEERTSIMLLSASEGFGSLATIMGQSFGEQSAAYQAMFALSKGFAIAESVIAIQQAVAKAMAIGFPQNIPLMAMAAAQGAQIIQTITATQPGFYSGGYTGDGPVGQVAGVVHGQEGVLNHQAMRGIGRQALDYMNRNHSIPPANDNSGGGITVNVGTINAGSDVSREEVYAAVREGSERAVVQATKISARDTNGKLERLARPQISAGRG